VFQSLLVIFSNRPILVHGIRSRRKGGAHKDLLSWHTRLLPTVADLGLVLIACSGIDMAIAHAEGSLNGFLNFVCFGELMPLGSMI
jgi:hypothetical protein